MVTSRQAVHGVFWGTIERAATQGISFVVVLLLARLLGPHNYGLVTLAATIALIGQMLLGETFSQALIQQKELEPAHTSSLFWMLAAIGLGASLIQFAAAPAIASFYKQSELTPVLRALSPLLVISALQAVPAALLKREMNFKAIAASSTTGTLLGGVSGVGLALSGFGVWSLVTSLLLQNAVIAASIWRRSGFVPGREFSHPHLSALWSYGQYTFLMRITAFISTQSPRLIVGYLFGPAALGAFNLGLRIVEMLYQLMVMPAANVIVPMIARMHDTPKRMENAILSVTQLVSMVAVPVYLGLAMTAPIIIPLLFGPRWAASIPLLQMLAIYGIIASSGLIWQSILGGLGRPDVALKTTTAAAIASVTVLTIGAQWGLTAAAAAFVFRGYLTLPFMPVILARLTGIPASRQYRVFIPAVIASAAMAAVIALALNQLHARLSPPLLLAAVILLGGAAYAATLLLVARNALQKGLAVFGQLRQSPA